MFLFCENNDLLLHYRNNTKVGKALIETLEDLYCQDLISKELAFKVVQLFDYQLSRMRATTENRYLFVGDIFGYRWDFDNEATFAIGNVAVYQEWTKKDMKYMVDLQKDFLTTPKREKRKPKIQRTVLDVVGTKLIWNIDKIKFIMVRVPSSQSQAKAIKAMKEEAKQVVKDNAVPMGQTSTGELAYWRRKEDKPKPPFKREDKKKIDSRSRNNLDFDRWMAKKKGEAVSWTGGKSGIRFTRPTKVPTNQRKR